MSEEIRNARKLLITPGAHRQVSAELSAAYDAHREAVIANYAHLVTAQIERCELTRQQQLAMPGKGREARAAAAACAEWLAGQPARRNYRRAARQDGMIYERRLDRRTCSSDSDAGKDGVWGVKPHFPPWEPVKSRKEKLREAREHRAREQALLDLSLEEAARDRLAGLRRGKATRDSDEGMAVGYSSD